MNMYRNFHGRWQRCTVWSVDGWTKLVQEVLKKHLENHLCVSEKSFKKKTRAPKRLWKTDLGGGNSHICFMFTPKIDLGKMKPFWPIFIKRVGWNHQLDVTTCPCVPNPAGEEVKFDFAGPIWGSLRFWLVGVWSLEWLVMRWCSAVSPVELQFSMKHCRIRNTLID